MTFMKGSDDASGLLASAASTEVRTVYLEKPLALKKSAMMAGSPASSHWMNAAACVFAFDFASSVRVQPPSVAVVLVWSPSIDGNGATIVLSIMPLKSFL